MNDRDAKVAHVPLHVALFSPVLQFLLRRRIPLGLNALVTIRGRRSGQPRTAALAVVQLGGRRWVWAPWGEVNWVKNLRESRHATITFRDHTDEFEAMELDPEGRVGFFRDVLGPLAHRIPLGVWFVRLVDGVNVNDPAGAAIGSRVFELQSLPPATR